MVTQNLLQEEINAIKEIQTEYQEIILAYGKLHLEKNILNETEKNIDEKYKNASIKETQLIQSLESKYGKGTIDLKTGTISPLSK